MGAVKESGYDDLWGWFGLSYAAWLTLPRVMMHEMSDEWQARMAKCLAEFDAEFPNVEPVATVVMCKRDGKYIKQPSWIGNYRHPDTATIQSFKAKP